MFNDLPPSFRNHELQRHAYNAAFHELGLRWFWDSDTYEQLMQRSADAGQRIRFFLETQQPHLLKAYDADFLAAAIHRAQLQYVERYTQVHDPKTVRCDWGQLMNAELGA
jgi:hypothetical protein